MKIYFIECPNQIFIFYFIFHFLFFIFQVSKIDWILHNYIYCNNIKVNDLNYYYSKYLYFSHFTISFTLFSYSIYIFFSYIYFLYFNKIFISKHCLYKFNINIYYFYYYFKKRNLFSKSYIFKILEKIKIFISIYPFQKSIFPVPDEKTVAKVKPRNIRWYFELVRHQYHLVSQAQISKGFTIAKSKRAFDPLCYTMLQSPGKKSLFNPIAMEYPSLSSPSNSNCLSTASKLWTRTKIPSTKCYV